MPFITIASGANHGLRYVAEAVPGTTPASPKTTSLTHNSCTLAASRDTIESGALRDDRMIPFPRTGNVWQPIWKSQPVPFLMSALLYRFF